MRAGTIGILVFWTVATFMATTPAQAQKSLSDGVDDLAAKLAASFGSGAKGRVAILPFRVLAGGENLLGTYLAQNLTNAFFNVGYRDIVERQMLDRAIKELKLQYSGMIDPESAKRVGKFLHADFVVGGTMSDQLGKVEVSCRMFTVETGEIVAVAKTELLKDDNVKAMLGQGGRQGGGSGQGDGDGPNEEPESKGVVYTQKAEGLSFELSNCYLNGDVLLCDLAVTALKKDFSIYLSAHSRVIDRKGNQVEAKTITVGGRAETIHAYLELVRGIALVARLRFDGLDTETKSLKLIEIVYGGGTSKVQFRDVALN